MNKKNDKLAIAIALVMLLFFSTFFIDYVGFLGRSFDYQNFWNCSKNGFFLFVGEGEGRFESQCSNYPPLFIWLGTLFSARHLFYQQFVLFLFAFVMPLVLYQITKEPITVWFYFSATNFFYALLSHGYLAQVFSMMLILSMVFLKEPYRILILPLTIIAHSTSFFIALVFYLLLVVEEYLSKKNIYERCRKHLPKVLGCSPFWGESPPPEMAAPVVEQAHTYHAIFDINTLLALLIKRTPLPFLIFSVIAFIKKRKVALFGIMLLFLAAGIFYNSRALYFVALPMVCGLGWYYKMAERKMKIALLGLSGIYFFFYVEQMVALGVLC